MMIDNPYTGSTGFLADGQRLTLVYTWDALARLRAGMGDEGQAKALAGDLDALSQLLALGLAFHHPDWDAARVRSASPPVIPAIKAVEAALSAAYFGPAGAPEAASPNPLRPPPTPLRGLWRRLTGRG